MDLLSSIVNLLSSVALLISLGFSRILASVAFWRVSGPRAVPETYEGWHAYEVELDKFYSVQEWADRDASKAYSYQSLNGFKTELETCRRSENLRGLCTHLRYQAWSRNICNILSPAMYRKSRLQTKKLVHDYLNEVKRCINIVIGETSTKYSVVVSKQEKKDLLRDMQASLGKTSLLLQGGAFVSMCHLGVVKALHQRGLLPRILTGTGSGALIAALIGSTPDINLADVLDGPKVDLGAFSRARKLRRNTESETWTVPRWWRAFVRRARRYAYTGHFFDIGVLADCAKDNLGNLTFEEAYSKTGRVLNITIAMPEVAGTPTLLNYITAPHVLIWSAVAASVATSKRLYAPAHLYCKDDTGQITQYFAVDASEVFSRRSVVHPESALERIGELFNVNHFIISQTRPYVIPFVLLQESADRWPLFGTGIKLVISEMVHWLHILKWLRILPNFFQRLLIDESLPNSENWSKIEIIPDLSFLDYFAVFNLPTNEKIHQFASKGERGVWPKVYQLQLRCAVEFQIDKARRTQF